MDKGNSEILDQNARNMQGIQLILNSNQYKMYIDLVGTPVKVKGSLLAGITAHHHTKILVSVDEIRAIE